MVLPMELAPSLDNRRPHLPRSVGEHDDVRAELGGRIDRVFAGGDRVDAIVEGVFWPRADLHTGLLIELAVPFDEAGLEGGDDHRRSLIEALPRFVHAKAEGRELAPRQAPAHAEPQLSP